jgi:hypothetical protein
MREPRPARKGTAMSQDPRGQSRALRQTMPFGQRNPHGSHLACPLGLWAHDSGLRADGSLIAWYATSRPLIGP